MDPRGHQRLVVVWQPGSGIAVHNVKGGVFHLFVCFFHNPILVGVVPQHTRRATNGDLEKALVMLRGLNLGAGVR